jgi:hypothetical protein
MTLKKFDQTEVDLLIAVNVLSDQTQRVEARLAEIEAKLDDNADRLSRMEAINKQSTKALDRYMGWALAVVLLGVELCARFVFE